MPDEVDTPIPQTATTREEYMRLRSEYKDKNTVFVLCPSGASFRIRKMSPLKMMSFMGDKIEVGDKDRLLEDYQSMKAGTAPDPTPPVGMREDIIKLLTTEEGEQFRNEIAEYVIVEPEGLKAEDLLEEDRDSLVVEAIKYSNESLILGQKKN